MTQLPIIAWDQAYNRNGDSSVPRTVVNVIRTFMDNHTLTGWIKAETLAEMTGLKVRAVRAQIAANVKAGWLEIVASGNSTGLANTYRLTYPKGVVHDTVSPEKGVVDDTVRVSSSAEKGVVNDTPTSPTTSPRNFSRSSEERTSPEGKGVVNDTVPFASDPFARSVEMDRQQITSELDRAVNDTVPSEEGDSSVTHWMMPGDQERVTDPFSTAPAAAPSAAVATLPTRNPFAQASGTPLERLTAEIRKRGGRLPIAGVSFYQLLGVQHDEAHATVLGFIKSGQVIEDLDDDGKPVALRLP